MTDLLVASGDKLAPKMLDKVAGMLDIEDEGVQVSPEGLSMVQRFLEKYPKKVSDAVKSPDLVSNLAKIISIFCGPGGKKGGFEAMAHKGKKHSIDFLVFEKALEVMDDLLIGSKNPADVVKSMSIGDFQTFVENLGAYVPRDVLYSTQELAMDILVRLASACQKKKEFKKNYQKLLASMPSAFADVVSDEELGPVSAMEHMRPLLLKVNERNANITSCTFHELSYDGGNHPVVHKAGALDFCRKWVCLTITEDPEAPGVKIAYSQVVKVHFVDDGGNSHDSKSLELVLSSLPDSLKDVLGLELPAQHSQGVFAIVLDLDAPMQALEETAKRSLDSEEADNIQELDRQIQAEVETRHRKTSFATTRSSSTARGASQVTPSGIDAAPSSTAVDRRFEAAVYEQERAAGEAEQKEARSPPMKSVSPVSAAVGSPTRRSSRLESKHSQGESWVAPTGAEVAAAEAKKKRALRETDDTDDFEPDTPRKAAKSSPSKAQAKAKTKAKAKAKAKGKGKDKDKGIPSRSESASTMQVPAAKSPARMRRSPAVAGTTEPLPGALAFAEAEGEEAMERGEESGAEGGPRQTDMQEEPALEFAWDEAMDMEDDMGPFSQHDTDRDGHDTAALLAEGRARAAAPPYAGLPKGPAPPPRASSGSTALTERELSYPLKEGGRRVLRDRVSVSVKKISTELFSSEEEEDLRSLPEPPEESPGAPRRGRKASTTSAAARRGPARARARAPTREHGRARKGTAEPWADDESSSTGTGMDVDVDIDEDDAYLSDDATAGASADTGGGQDRLSFLANEFIKEQALRQRNKMIRMVTAQADAAIEQVQAYLQAWVANRAEAHKLSENEDNVLVASFTNAAEAKRGHMHREAGLLQQRAKELSQALRRRKEEADALAREIEAYERMCRDEDEEYKADVKRRYEVLARGLKKVADQEQQASKEAKKRQEQLEEALKGA